MAFVDICNQIATDLTRSDLLTGGQIGGAVNEAIAHYEHDRFWFNTTRSLTFQTVIGQSTYTGADLAQIPNLIRIDKLFLRWGITTFPLDWYEPDEFEFIAGLNTANGKPSIYMYKDGQLTVWPPPSAVWTMRPHMHYRLTPYPLVANSDSTAWVVEGEKLIRAHAKLILYSNLLEDDEGAQRMQAQVGSHKAKLDYETAARLASGRIRAPVGYF